eukprot:9936670-Prorocentrum_lima.AAC.1
MCRQWYQYEIAQRDRELLARSEHQELVDGERYKELKDQYSQVRVNNTELRTPLYDLHARKTPSTQDNMDPGGTPSPTPVPVGRTVPVMASRVIHI